jgi:hypothetical protein
VYAHVEQVHHLLPALHLIVIALVAIVILPISFFQSYRQQQEQRILAQHHLIHSAARSQIQNIVWIINVLTQDAQFIAARLVMVIKFPLQLQGGVTHSSSIAVDQLLAHFKLQLSTTLLTWLSSILVPIVTLSGTLAS